MFFIMFFHNNRLHSRFWTHKNRVSITFFTIIDTLSLYTIQWSVPRRLCCIQFFSPQPLYPHRRTFNLFTFLIALNRFFPLILSRHINEPNPVQYSMPGIVRCSSSCLLELLTLSYPFLFILVDLCKYILTKYFYSSSICPFPTSGFST